MSETYIFIRLNNWIHSIILNNESIIYSVHPDHNGGILHQTLLQFISFKESIHYTNEEINKSLEICKQIMKENNIYIRIVYRGLVWTKTGLALKGFPYDIRDYDKIMKLRILIETKLKELKLPCDIPYTNDIIHSTFLRWKNKPSQNVIELLNKSLHKWDECVFGEIRISKWVIGKASWKMLDYERKDIYIIDSTNNILHRGIRKIDKLLENSPDTLNKRYNEQYYVECDIWYQNDNWYLGHDTPEFLIDIEDFLKIKTRIIHAKDGYTFAKLIKYCNERGYDNEIFYHTTEDYVLTSSKNIIAYPGKYLHKNTICMMPENMNRDLSEKEKNNIIAICSDLL